MNSVAAKRSDWSGRGLGASFSVSKLTATLRSEAHDSISFPYLSPQEQGLLLRDAVHIQISNTEERARVVSLELITDIPWWRVSFHQWVVADQEVSEYIGGAQVASFELDPGPPGRVRLLLAPGSPEQPSSRWLKLVLAPVSTRGTYETQGRFRLELSEIEGGAEPSSHKVLEGSLVVSQPRSRLVRQLPAIYQYLPDSSGDLVNGGIRVPFFHRYLLGFESELDKHDQLLDRMDDLFGAMTAPSVLLPFLARWVVMPVDGSWSEMKLRQLIREAIWLHSMRGTKLALARILEIYCESRPRIEDRPVEGVRLGARFRLGAKESELGNVSPYWFSVMITLRPDQDINEEFVREIIRAYKPAHTSYTLHFERRLSGETLSVGQEQKYAT